MIVIIHHNLSMAAAGALVCRIYYNCHIWQITLRWRFQESPVVLLDADVSSSPHLDNAAIVQLWRKCGRNW